MSFDAEIEFHTPIHSPDIGSVLVRLRVSGKSVERTFSRKLIDDNVCVYGAEGTTLARVEGTLRRIFESSGPDGLMNSAAWNAGG